MAKPFKSEFDLMAEAYGTISYDKQQLINEDKAGRRVIGYPPQLVTENSDEDAERAEGAPYIDTDKYGTYYYSDAAKTVLHRTDGPAVEETDGFKAWYVNGKRHREDGPAIEDPDSLKEWFVNGRLHREDGPAQEDEKTGFKRWFINGKRVNEDGSPHTDYYGDEDAESVQPSDSHEEDDYKVDYGPSGEGKPVHPDEAAESAPGMNSRIDGMIDRDALGAAQAALQNILADLHANGEEFEAADVAAFIASTLS
jgi:hypothetical protein